jgi:hypothetical protein
MYGQMVKDNVIHSQMALPSVYLTKTKKLKNPRILNYASIGFNDRCATVQATEANRDHAFSRWHIHELHVSYLLNFYRR